MDLHAYIAEVVGTAILVLLGDGVVANVVLSKTKGNGSGWIVITFGWGMAVFVAVFCVATFSGALINPAVTIGLAVAGQFAWSQVVPYILAQILGAMIGAFLVWVSYKKHYDEEPDPAGMLATFCTAPEIRSLWHNFLTEVIATFILVLGILYLVPLTYVGEGHHQDVLLRLALPVGLLVFAIGLSLGGPTGYAINPARDLGPRIMHAILPIKGKKGSDWGYAVIPIIGPIVGGVLAAFAYSMFGLLPA